MEGGRNMKGIFPVVSQRVEEKMRKGIGFLAGAIFGVALVATCSNDTAPAINGGQDLAGLLDRDLAAPPGSDLSTLGDLFPGFDIATADAAGSGSMLFTATCDKSATRTIVYSTFTSAETVYFAEVAVPGLQPTDSPHVTATGCNLSYNAGSAPPPFFAPCPTAGVTSCSDSGYALPAGTCIGLSAYVATGKVIVTCGYHYTYSNGTPDSGSLPGSVYVRVG
jgi:hypothetical protein